MTSLQIYCLARWWKHFESRSAFGWSYFQECCGTIFDSHRPGYFQPPSLFPRWRRAGRCDGGVRLRRRRWSGARWRRQKVEVWPVETTSKQRRELGCKLGCFVPQRGPSTSAAGSQPSMCLGRLCHHSVCTPHSVCFSMCHCDMEQSA